MGNLHKLRPLRNVKKTWNTTTLLVLRVCARWVLFEGKAIILSSASIRMTIVFQLNWLGVGSLEFCRFFRGSSPDWWTFLLVVQRLWTMDPSHYIPSWGIGTRCLVSFPFWVWEILTKWSNPTKEKSDRMLFLSPEEFILKILFLGVCIFQRSLLIYIHTQKIVIIYCSPDPPYNLEY